MVLKSTGEKECHISVRNMSENQKCDIKFVNSYILNENC